MALFRSQWERGKARETKRIRRLGVVLSVFMMIVLSRAFQFQVWKREPWKSMAPRQYQSRVKLQAERGVIYDRNMNILAMDLPISCVAIDPGQINDTEPVTRFLAEVLNDQEDAYRQLIDNNKEIYKVNK